MRKYNKYIYKHDYGYGKENDSQTINKLTLRNFRDLVDYIAYAIEKQIPNAKVNYSLISIDNIPHTKIKLEFLK